VLSPEIFSYAWQCLYFVVACARARWKITPNI
jgi:hypothetical protein